MEVSITKQEICVLEKSFQGDKLIKTTVKSPGRDFKEHRKFTKNNITLEYFFITRCLHDELLNYVNSIKNGRSSAPHVIVMNSTLWDLTRWGPKGVEQFKDDLRKLMSLLKEVLRENSMFIWTTALPPGKNIKKGSLLIKQVEFLEHIVRFDIMEANLFASKVVREFGFDVLDMHYHLRMQIHRRNADGLHFSPLPIRLLTNILLTHLALSWNCKLPNNVNNTLLQRYKDMPFLPETEEVKCCKMPSAPPNYVNTSNNAISNNKKKKKKKNNSVSNNSGQLKVNNNNSNNNNRNSKTKNISNNNNSNTSSFNTSTSSISTIKKRKKIKAKRRRPNMSADTQCLRFGRDFQRATLFPNYPTFINNVYSNFILQQETNLVQTIMHNVSYALNNSGYDGNFWMDRPIESYNNNNNSYDNYVCNMQRCRNNNNRRY